ncbi:hypothetical protein B0T19DRAFT_419310 [Cercophora scortea]|uniref:Uncharacterized protein n=1 Tax=Cercophora scortea TaxID=314031 RepID=A0AAE0MIH8_9PEZI|nr:hypothetical protein B0T19DRAFT_419310 [Cercophora scortea]
MPQDPNLYGQRPAKKQKKEMAVTGSLSFTSQLSSLLATQSANTNTASSSSNTANTPISGRPRPSKAKTDLFSNVKVKRKATTTDPAPTKLALKTPQGTEDEKTELAHARRKMESKARLYAAMQRGDYVGREIGLVDFDRKWAEKEQKKNNAAQNPSTSHDNDDGLVSSSSSSESEEENNNDTELVEYEDEFGRLRQGTRADKLRFERRLARGEASAAELDRMSARPKAPENLIFGDAVQADAFLATHDTTTMEELARKRDRSPTPPPAVHYEADREIRTKGVGFYAFSKDEETRKAEMESLEKERERTEALRREREEKISARKREIEQRRREIGERRARKLADSFLDGLGADLLGGGGDAGGSGSGGGK